MSPLRVIARVDGPALLRRAGSWLESAEAENCYLLGDCGSHKTGAAAPDCLFLSVEDTVGLVGVAVWVPPGPLSLSRIPETAAPGCAPGACCEPRARRRSSRFRRTVRRGMGGDERHAPCAGDAAGVFQLTRVRPPRPVEGHFRKADPGDVSLLEDWAEAFAIEMGLPSAEQTAIRRAPAQWVADQPAALWVSDADPCRWRWHWGRRRTASA